MEMIALINRYMAGGLIQMLTQMLHLSVLPAEETQEKMLEIWTSVASLRKGQEFLTVPQSVPQQELLVPER